LNGFEGTFDVEFKLGLQDCILNGVPLEDFGDGHPDPNLTYVNNPSNQTLPNFRVTIFTYIFPQLCQGASFYNVRKPCT
jgi:hypothetical protein